MRLLSRLSAIFWRIKPFRWVFMLTFAAFLGIAAGKTVLAFSGSVAVVDGLSMEPTYEPSARVYTTSISSPIRRADIVLLDDGKREYALKRVVGLPGETVIIWRGYVFINRRMLKETYLPKYTYTFPDETAGNFVFVLGPEEYFVMGDNRTASIDSRSYGPVERRKIKSRVPLPESFQRPETLALTLPEEGKRTIRRL
jgi:signal peptidase I